jgi:hypothetical protein
MSESAPEEPQAQPEPPEPQPPAFELETTTFETVEKANKDGHEYRDLRPDN